MDVFKPGRSLLGTEAYLPSLGCGLIGLKCRKSRGKRVIWLPQDIAAQEGIMPILVAGARQIVFGHTLEIAIALKSRCGPTCGDRIGQRNINGGFYIPSFETSHPHFNIGAEFRRRCFADVLDGTTVGVATKQGSLRAAQDFYPLHLHQVCLQHTASALPDAIQIDTNPRHASYSQGRVLLTQAAGTNHEIGNHDRDIARRGHVSQLHLFAAKCRNRYSDVLGRLFTAPGTHHDFLY